MKGSIHMFITAVHSNMETSKVRWVFELTNAGPARRICVRKEWAAAVSVRCLRRVHEVRAAQLLLSLHSDSNAGEWHS